MTETKNCKSEYVQNIVRLNLPSLAISVRSLLSSYLIVVGLGALLASLQILMTHGMADGDFGLSVDDVVYSYHGNPAHSKIETKLNGSMKDKASASDRLKIIKWVRQGAHKDKWESDIKEIFDKNCISCHSIIPGLPNFTRLEAVQKVSQPSAGASTTSLTRSSHIHIFAISFIFLFNGLILSLAVGMRSWLKISIVCLPFLFLIIDVFSWWLTKIHPGFAWLTIISGVGYSLCSAITWFVCMYQMWVLPKKGKVYNFNAWSN